MTKRHTPRRASQQTGIAILGALALLGCSLGDDAPGTETQKLHGKDVKRTYLLIATDTLPTGLQSLVEAQGGTLVQVLPEVGTAVVSGSSSFAQELRRQSGILAVVPDFPLKLEAGEVLPDPPFAPMENDFLYNLQWGHAAIDTPLAWAAGARGAGVRVAVLDTGISRFHPDTAPNLNAALSASFIPGEDPFIRAGTFPSHGTGVAATIAAPDNGMGIIGVAPEAELVSVKVLSEFSGSGTVSSITGGLVYAANIGADIVNMSFGDVWNREGMVFDNFTPDPSDDVVLSAKDVHDMTEPIKRALRYADDAGVTLVGITQNDGLNIDALHDSGFIVIPLELSPDVIGVAATGPHRWAFDPTTNLDLPAFYNNYGTTVVDLTAPGGNPDLSLRASGQLCTVYVTAPCFFFDFVLTASSDGYGWAAGTSFAAPHVTGVAALVIGQNGGSMAPEAVYKVLRTTADDLGDPGKDAIFGSGRVNAARAVGAF